MSYTLTNHHQGATYQLNKLQAKQTFEHEQI